MSRRRSRRRDRERELLIRKRLIIFTALAALLVFFFLFFQLRVVRVKGNLHEKPEEVTALLLTRPSAGNTLLTALMNMNRTITTPGFIESVRCEILARDALRVYVTERKFVGCAEYKGKWWYFDSSGKVMAEAASPVEGELTPPVEGLAISAEPTLTFVLPTSNTRSFAMLGMLRNRIEVNNALRPDKVIFEGSAMTLVYGDVNVLMGTGEKLELRLRQLNALLPELTSGYSGTLHMETYDGSQGGIVFDKS